MSYCILGSGTNGCIIQPAILSNTLDSKFDVANKVSKIFRYKDSAYLEYDINMLVKNIDQKRDFTIECHCYKQFSKDEIKKIFQQSFKKGDRDECHKNSSKYLNVFLLFSDPSHIIFDYGGIHIDRYFSLHFEYFISKWTKIIKGIYKLNKNNIFHNDIKPLNILYDNQKERLNLVDFGNAKTSETFRDFILDENIINSRYRYFPPEYLWLNKKNRNKDEFFSIIAYQYKNIIHHKEYEALYNYLQSIEKENTQNNEFVPISNAQMYECLEKESQTFHHKKYAYCLDVFSLGVTLLENYTKSPKSCQKWCDKNIFPIIKKMCNPILKNRMMIDEALQKWKQNEKIKNPKTNRYVLALGRTGKKIQKP